jgi:hypothetical protein
MGSGATTWSPIRPAYLAPLTSSTVAAANRHNIGVRRVQGSTDPNAFAMVWNGVERAWDAAVPAATLPFDTVVEMNIALGHPLHLHMYNMQVCIITCTLCSSTSQGHGVCV